MRSIIYNKEIPDDNSKNKQLRIGIGTEQNDIKMIEQLFINEVKLQGSKEEAICSFKVICFNAFLGIIFDRVKTKPHCVYFRDYWIQ